MMAIVLFFLASFFSLATSSGCLQFEPRQMTVYEVPDGLISLTSSDKVFQNFSTRLQKTSAAEGLSSAPTSFKPSWLQHYDLSYVVLVPEQTTNMSILGVWERHSLVGVETCKIRCVRTGSCRAVLYSPTLISCFLTLDQAPAAPPPGFILFARETLKVHGKHCTDICRNGVCLKTHSSKNVCGITHCVEFKRPPVIPFSTATVKLTEGGATAIYRCQTNYSFFQRNSTQLALCHVNCTWESPRFKCTKTRVDKGLLSLNAAVRLPVHFSRGITVRLCGIPRGKESFTINFVRKKDILLHMNPRFKVWTIYGLDKRLICFAAAKNGIFMHETKAKVFFFKRNRPFCMSLRRVPGHYQLLDGGGKVRYSIKDYFKHRKAYNISVGKMELTRVEMAMSSVT